MRSLILKTKTHFKRHLFNVESVKFDAKLILFTAADNDPTEWIMNHKQRGRDALRQQHDIGNLYMY